MRRFMFGFDAACDREWASYYAVVCDALYDLDERTRALDVFHEHEAHGCKTV
jgi:hypothetical protein